MPEVRLIDANALHAKIYEDSERSYGASANIAQVLLRIETAPTIKADIVRHGRWISRRAEFGTGIMYECSVCHKICEHYTHIHYDPPPYCMHCGAKMEKMLTMQ